MKMQKYGWLLGIALAGVSLATATIVMRSDLLTVVIHAGDVEELRELVSTLPYDFGCRPSAISTAKGDYILPALLN
jgi:hypothetical protein